VLEAFCIVRLNLGALYLHIHTLAHIVSSSFSSNTLGPIVVYLGISSNSCIFTFCI